ncbi:MAG: hypothetical protein QXO71_03360 [Candidatus Jordarchaeaceae archaeon]
MEEDRIVEEFLVLEERLRLLNGYVFKVESLLNVWLTDVSDVGKGRKVEVEKGLGLNLNKHCYANIQMKEDLRAT